MRVTDAVHQNLKDFYELWEARLIPFKIRRAIAIMVKPKFSWMEYEQRKTIEQRTDGDVCKNT